MTESFVPVWISFEAVSEDKDKLFKYLHLPVNTEQWKLHKSVIVHDPKNGKWIYGNKCCLTFGGFSFVVYYCFAFNVCYNMPLKVFFVWLYHQENSKLFLNSCFVNSFKIIFSTIHTDILSKLKSNTPHSAYRQNRRLEETFDQLTSQTIIETPNAFFWHKINTMLFIRAAT